MFVLKIIRDDDDPDDPKIPPFESRQAAMDWVQANAWGAPYHADRVELHKVDTADRSTARALAEKNAGEVVWQRSRPLTEAEQQNYDKESARRLFRDLVKKLKGDHPPPPPPPPSNFKRRI